MIYIAYTLTLLAIVVVVNALIGMFFTGSVYNSDTLVSMYWVDYVLATALCLLALFLSWKTEQ